MTMTKTMTKSDSAKSDDIASLLVDEGVSTGDDAQDYSGNSDIGELTDDDIEYLIDAGQEYHGGKRAGASTEGTDVDVDVDVDDIDNGFTEDEEAITTQAYLRQGARLSKEMINARAKELGEAITELQTMAEMGKISHEVYAAAMVKADTLANNLARDDMRIQQDAIDSAQESNKFYDHLESLGMEGMADPIKRDIMLKDGANYLRNVKGWSEEAINGINDPSVILSIYNEIKEKDIAIKSRAAKKVARVKRQRTAQAKLNKDAELANSTSTILGRSQQIDQIARLIGS